MAKNNTFSYRHCSSIFTQLLTISLFLLLIGSAHSTTESPGEFDDDVTTTVSSIASPMRRTYTNEWAVRIAGGKVEDAERLANKYGYTNLGPVSYSENKFDGVYKCYGQIDKVQGFIFSVENFSLAPPTFEICVFKVGDRQNQSFLTLKCDFYIKISGKFHF